METGLIVSVVVLAIATAWNYAIAKDAQEDIAILKMKIEGLQQKYDAQSYKLYIIDERLQKKRKK